MAAPELRVVLTKLTDRTHRLEVFREGERRECAELETRSLLLHDLVHFAVEAEAGLRAAFYGQLAAGTPMAELARMDDPALSPDLAVAESLVGPMQSLYNGRVTRAAYVETTRSRLPGVVDEAFVDRVLERLRRLTGEWRATPFGASMALEWPPPPLD